MKIYIYIITFISLLVMQVESAKCDENKLLSDSTKSQDTVKVEKKAIFPEDFNGVDSEPKIDIWKLSSYVVYPEEARKAGIEGKVSIAVFVLKDGTATKEYIEYSDNSLLNESAMKAIKEYFKENKIIPAISKGKSVDCWTLIPISYKLRPLKETKQE